MVSKELIAASTRPLVLGVLSKGESYGYEIIREIRTRSDGQLEWVRRDAVSSVTPDGERKIDRRVMENR